MGFITFSGSLIPHRLELSTGPKTSLPQPFQCLPFRAKDEQRLSQWDSQIQWVRKRQGNAGFSVGFWTLQVRDPALGLRAPPSSCPTALSPLSSTPGSFILMFPPFAFFLDALVPCGSSRARDGIYTTAATQATAVTIPILNPLSHKWLPNLCFLEWQTELYLTE